MAEAGDINRGQSDPLRAGAPMSTAEVQAWFVREVLPLEAALMQFLRRIRPTGTDVSDLCQDVYVRVCEAAMQEIPRATKPFVFMVARNLAIDELRRERVVPIDTASDIELLNIAADTPMPEQSVIAREELRRLQIALNELPLRCREAIVMRKIEDIPRRQIAIRMGIAEKTVARHITEGIFALADALYGEESSEKRRK